MIISYFLLILLLIMTTYDFDLFQYFINNDITSLDESSASISHKSACSNGLRYPVHANRSNQAKNKRDRKLADCSGDGF